jgi:hypothetical protein
MTSFMNMYVSPMIITRSVSRVPRLQQVGAAAAIVEVADLNKCKFTHDYQSAMSLFVNDFT